MQELVHHSIQMIEKQFVLFNKVQGLYHAKSFQFDGQFDSFLADLLGYFQAKGNTTLESEVLKTINMIATVKRGFNPIKMEKISSGKRELLSGYSFNGMESIHGILLEMFNKEKKKLDEGEILLEDVMVSLFQNNILDDDKIITLNTITKIEVFWNQLTTQNQLVSSINKKLRLTLLPEDVFLLLEKILQRLH